MIDSHKIDQHSHLIAKSEVFIFLSCTGHFSHTGHTIFMNHLPKPNTWILIFNKKTFQLDAKTVGSEYYVKGPVYSVSSQLMLLLWTGQFCRTYSHKQNT